MKNIFKSLIVWTITCEAKMVLKKYKPRIVAVTGSVGKTSTKDAVFTVLSSFYFVRKSEKSFNSDIGVPLTILGLPNAWNNPLLWIQNIFKGLSIIIFTSKYPQWLVLEVGADRPGDIYKVTRWLKPDIAILTRFGKIPVHVEYFESREELVQEKAWLAKELKKDGVLIYNSDDEDAVSIALETQRKKMSYGFSNNPDVEASYDQILYEDGRPVGMSFKVGHAGSSVPVIIRGGLGRQHIYPALVALASAVSCGENLVSASAALEKHETPRARIKIIAGISQSTLLDDTYNASPVAVAEALSVLEKISVSGKKIAVLGDMMELGKYSADEHREAGKRAAQAADLVVVVGVRAEFIAAGAREAGMAEEFIIKFADSTTAAREVPKMVGGHDVVLVKGSQSMRMERVSKALMENPELAKDVLVRQEEEWKRR